MTVKFMIFWESSSLRVWSSSPSSAAFFFRAVGGRMAESQRANAVFLSTFLDSAEVSVTSLASCLANSASASSEGPRFSCLLLLAERTIFSSGEGARSSTYRIRRLDQQYVWKVHVRTKDCCSSSSSSAPSSSSWSAFECLSSSSSSPLSSPLSSVKPINGIGTKRNRQARWTPPTNSLIGRVVHHINGQGSLLKILRNLHLGSYSLFLRISQNHDMNNERVRKLTSNESENMKSTSIGKGCLQWT